MNECRLPANYSAKSEDQKAQLEAHCAAVNAGLARECARRQAHLAEWINTPESDKR